MKFAVLGMIFFFAAQPAVAMPMPDLYPNAFLKKAGPDKANADIGACSVNAENYVAQGGKKPGVLGNSARGAAKGAAKGALAGAIFNGQAGRGAGAGAALGGLSSAGGSVREKKDGSPEYRAFVEACLEDKGYKVIGWK